MSFGDNLNLARTSREASPVGCAHDQKSASPRRTRRILDLHIEGFAGGVPLNTEPAAVKPRVLEGDYEFTVDGKTFVAKMGATIFAPRGLAHTYRYLGKTPGRLMCVITPAEFEGFFEAIRSLA